MADPFSLPNPFSLPDPFSLDPRARSPRPPPQFPPFAPEEEESYLGNIGSAALGGLGYIGKILDKTFGGRAVRGVLGGKPRELLSILPLSDTLSLTDEADVVSGRELLEKADFLGPNTEGFDWGDVAGFGAEVLLDPASWIATPLGAATKLGAAAKKIGVVPKTLAGRMRGLQAASPEAAKLASQLGVDVSEVAGKPLGGLIGTGGLSRLFGFGDVALGAGPRSQAVAKVLGQAGQAAKFGRYSPVPALRGMFSHLTGGTPHPLLQQIHEGTVLPAREAGEAEILGGHVARLREAKRQGYLNDREVEETIRQIMEGALPPSGPTAAVAAEMSAQLRAGFDENLELGLEGGFLPNYAPRYAQPLPPGKGGGLKGALRRFFQTSDPSMMHRQAALMGPSKRLSTAEFEALVRDPQVSGPAATLNPLQAQDYLRVNVFGNPPPGGPGYAEATQQAGQLAGMLRNLSETFAAEGRRFFSSPLDDFTTKQLHDLRSRTGAKGIHELLSNAAKPTAALTGKSVPVEQVLKDAGLGAEATDAAGVVRGGRAHLAKKLGVRIQDLAGLSVPADVAQAATKYLKPFTAPESLEPLVTLVDNLTNTFKGSVTVPFPGFHFRNIVTGAWQNWIGDAYDPTVGGAWNPAAYVKPFLDGKQLADGGVIDGIAKAQVFARMGITSDADATRQVADWLYQYGAGGPRGLSQREAMITGPAGEALQSVEHTLPGTALEKPSLRGYLPKSLAEANPLNVPGGPGADPQAFAPVREGDKAARYVDFVNRASGFIAKLKQGFAPELAAAHTKALHYDYKALSPFEQAVMRRLVPFYSFSRHNVPFVLEQFATEPFKQAAAVRAGQAASEGGFTPPWIGEGLAVNLGGVPLFGTPPEGTARYLSSLGLPLEDEPLKALGEVLHGRPGRALAQLGGQINPLLKYPIEEATGVQLHTGRQLQDLRPSAAASVLSGFNEEYARPLSQLLANTPASRVISTLDKLVDTLGPEARKGVGATALNLLTGARVTDVDLDKARAVEGRKILDKLLAGKPELRRFQKFYPAEGEVLDPETVTLLRLSEGLRQRAHRAAVEQRAQEGDPEAKKELERLKRKPGVQKQR